MWRYYSPGLAILDRMPFLRRFWPIIFLLLLPILPLWKCVFAGEAIGPFDQIRQMAPWNGPKPEQPWDVLQADGVLQFYPWRDMVFRSYADGHLPLWNNYELAGTPLLANSQSGGFYPPHIAMGVMHVPTPTAITFLAWFHLALAGLGVYALSRRMGASRLGAAVGGASFELSAFMLSWTALASVISTVAWIPWILLGVHALTDGCRWKPGFATVAFATAMMILAGHLQFVAYGFMAAFLLVTVMAIQLRKAPPALVVLGGLVLGVCLAAPQLFPVLNFSQYSHRKVAPSAGGYDAYVAGSIKPFDLATLGSATALGNPRKAVVIGDGSSVSTYWPMYAKQGANLAESAVTIGPLLLGLLVLVDWRRRSAQAMGITGILALLLALGTALNMPLYYLVPGWSSTGSPGRIIVLFVMAACVLGALGASETTVRPRKLQGAIGLAVGGSVVLAMLFPTLAPAWQPGLQQLGEAIRGTAQAASILPLLVSVIAGALGIYTLTHQNSKFRPLVLVWCLASIFAALPELVSTGKPIDILPATKFDRVAVINSGWGIVSAAPAILPPNTAYFEGLHELGGYDSLLHKDTKAMLDKINGDKDSAPPANGNMMFIKPGVEGATLSEAGVTSIYSRNGVETITSPGRASLEGRPARILSENAQQIKLRVSGPGRLILRDRNMPGWLPKVDGQHVPMQGTNWREIDLPAGEHEVEFNYVPPGMMQGVYLAFPAWLGLALLAIAAIRERTSSKEQEPPLTERVSANG